MQKAKVLKKYKTKDEKGKCTCGTSIHHPRQGQFTLEVKYCFSHLGGGRIFSFMAFVKHNLIVRSQVKGQKHSKIFVNYALSISIFTKKTTQVSPKLDQIDFSNTADKTVKDTTPSKLGLHQSRICLSLVRCCPPAWLSPISAEYVANRTPSEVAVSPYLICVKKILKLNHVP